MTTRMREFIFMDAFSRCFLKLEYCLVRGCGYLSNSKPPSKYILYFQKGESTFYTCSTLDLSSPP